MDKTAVGIPIELSRTTDTTPLVGPLDPNKVVERIVAHQLVAKDNEANRKLQEDLEWSKTVDTVYDAIQARLTGAHDMVSSGSVTRFDVDIRVKTSLSYNGRSLTDAINQRLDVTYKKRLACQLIMERVTEHVGGCHDETWCCLDFMLCCLPGFLYDRLKRRQHARGDRYKICVQIRVKGVMEF